MKALFVSHCNDLSGANKSLISLIEQLKSRMEIKVLCNQEYGKLTEYLKHLGIQVIFADYAWWYIKPRKNIIKQSYRKIVDTYNYKTKKITKKIINELNEEKFNFIYTNTSVVDVGAIISEALNIPHIWHIREFGQEDFGLIPILSLEQQKMVFRKASKIIVISEALKKKYISFIPHEKLQCIYNGFETENLVYIKETYPFHRKKILITGQVCKGKGQEQAILAINNLHKEGIDSELFIAGEIDYSYLNPILKKIGGKPSWLHILGVCKDMYLLRKDMDIELVCSRSEAFGRVILEAMLHSIPVIGSFAGGIPELIEDHKTGLLFEYGNIETLTDCIKELLFDNDLYEKIIINAREFAKKFSIQNTSRQIYTIFTEFEKND